MEGPWTTSPIPDKLPFFHAELLKLLACLQTLNCQSHPLQLKSSVWNSDNSELISGRETAKCYWSGMDKVNTCSPTLVFTCSIEEGPENSDPFLRDGRSQSQHPKWQLHNKKPSSVGKLLVLLLLWNIHMTLFSHRADVLVPKLFIHN